MSNLKLEGELSLDGSGWERTLGQAEKGVNHLAKDTMGTLKAAFAGAFAIGGLAEAIKSAIEFGGEINDTATRLGVSKTAAQEFSFSAKQTGIELGDVATSLGKLSKAIVAVEDGGEEGAKMEKAFARLGVTMAEIKGKSPEELFKLIAEKMEGMTITAEVSAATMEVFGKSGTKLIPMLKELSENIQKAHDHGLILDDGAIAQLDEAGDIMAELSLAAKIFGAAILVGTKAAATGWLDYAKALAAMNEQADSLVGGARIRALEKTLAAQKELADALKENSERKTVDQTDRTESEMHERTQTQAALEKDTATRRAKRFAKEDDGLPTEEHIDKVKAKIEELQAAGAKFELGSLASADIENQIEQQADKLEELQKKNLEQKFSALEKKNNTKFTPGKADTFVSAGNFLGESRNNIPQIQERLIDAHKQTTDALNQLTSAIRSGGSGTNPIGGFQ